MACKGEKLRRFKTFSYGARSWSKERCVIARVEVGPMGRDTRSHRHQFDRFTRASISYERVYPARAAKPRTTSRVGRHTSLPTGHLAQKPAPTRCGSCCMAAHTGCGWTLRAACPKRAPHGDTPRSTHCACIWSNWPRPSSRRKTRIRHNPASVLPTPKTLSGYCVDAAGTRQPRHDASSAPPTLKPKPESTEQT